jgi:hypothetical protein
MPTRLHPALPVMGRRRFLQCSAALGAALTVPLPAAAAQIGAMRGEVYVNGIRAGRTTVIRPGDKIETGPGSSVAFVLGQDAFLLRQLTSMMMETAGDSIVITGLRLVSGALAAVFGGGMKSIRTSMAVAGIRGTGIYVETRQELTYFCTCYGEVDLVSAADNSGKNVKARNHASHYVYAKAARGASIVEAPMINHTNAELAMLERLAGREPRLPEKKR